MGSLSGHRWQGLQSPRLLNRLGLKGTVTKATSEFRSLVKPRVNMVLTCKETTTEERLFFRRLRNWTHDVIRPSIKRKDRLQREGCRVGAYSKCTFESPVVQRAVNSSLEKYVIRSSWVMMTHIPEKWASACVEYIKRTAQDSMLDP